MNHYPVNVFWSKEDKGYIAVRPDLPGCTAFGETEQDALREARDAAASWLQAAKASKRSIPKPSQPAPLDYSGKFIMRVPRQLHADLSRSAAEQGVSLNQYLLYLITQQHAQHLA